MPISIDLFTDGQLGTTQQTLYAPSLGQSVSAKVTLVNTSKSSTVKVDVFLKKGTNTARRIIPRQLELKPQHKFSTCYHELGDDASFEGLAGAATAVDFVVNGVLTSS